MLDFNIGKKEITNTGNTVNSDLINLYVIYL